MTSIYLSDLGEAFEFVGKRLDCYNKAKLEYQEDTGLWRVELDDIQSELIDNPRETGLEFKKGCIKHGLRKGNKS